MVICAFFKAFRGLPSFCLLRAYFSMAWWEMRRFDWRPVARTRLWCTSQRMVA
jgi:hypothetical protein